MCGRWPRGDATYFTVRHGCSHFLWASSRTSCLASDVWRKATRVLLQSYRGSYGSAFLRAMLGHRSSRSRYILWVVFMDDARRLIRLQCLVDPYLDGGELVIGRQITVVLVIQLYPSEIQVYRPYRLLISRCVFVKYLGGERYETLSNFSDCPLPRTIYR